MKTELKKSAIGLRKKGMTYSEILRQIPVAKSTLSLWLRSVSLSERQYQKFTEKKRASQKRGGEARRNERLLRVSDILSRSKVDIGNLSERELWLMGIMLYWAEGSKEKPWRVGCRVSFNNSDPKMINFFLRWLRESLKIHDRDIQGCLYIHDSWKEKGPEVLSFWAKNTSLSYNNLNKIYFKHNKVGTRRKNLGIDYHGVLRITVRNSTDLNRKIAGWVEGSCL